MTICPPWAVDCPWAAGRPPISTEDGSDDDVRRPYANGGILATLRGIFPMEDIGAAGRKYRPAHMRINWEPRRLYGTHAYLPTRCWRQPILLYDSACCG